MHLPFDLRMKGSTDNYSTRPGEGFQQEVQQAFDQTNFRNTDSQACVHIVLVLDLDIFLDDENRRKSRGYCSYNDGRRYVRYTAMHGNTGRQREK